MYEVYVNFCIFCFVNEYVLNMSDDDLSIQLCEFFNIKRLFLLIFLFRALHLFLCLFAHRGEDDRRDACQIMRVESEKFKKYSKFNYPAVDDPRAFEIVRAANASVEK